MIHCSFNNLAYILGFPIFMPRDGATLQMELMNSLTTASSRLAYITAHFLQSPTETEFHFLKALLQSAFSSWYVALLLPPPTIVSEQHGRDAYRVKLLVDLTSFEDSCSELDEIFREGQVPSIQFLLDIRLGQTVGELLQFSGSFLWTLPGMLSHLLHEREVRPGD